VTTAAPLTTLPGGLRVATAEIPHATSAAIGIWIGVGGRHEPARLNGVSHFLEHLLFKGTRRRSAVEISRAIEGIGGYLNAFTDEEHTCFYARAQADRWPELLDVLIDMQLGSVLAPAEINRERGVIREELAMYRDQPAEYLHDLLNAAQFGIHPLGRPVIGTEASLRRMRRPELAGYLAQNYVSGATVIVGAGRLRHAELVRTVRKLAPGFRTGPQPGFVTAAEPGPTPRFKHLRKDTEQTHLGLALRTASRTDPRRFALRLLNVVLGENMSSRLFQVIRERHGLAYNIQSSTSFWADTGDLVITAGVEHRALKPALRLIWRELRRLSDRPISPPEFQRARDYVLGQWELSREGTEHQMMALGEQVLGFGAPIAPDTIRAELTRVTPRQIQACARDFFQPGRATLACLGPGVDDTLKDRIGSE